VGPNPVAARLARLDLAPGRADPLCGSTTPLLPCLHDTQQRPMRVSLARR